MRASDQFHTGLVTSDFDATLTALSELLGYKWADEIVVDQSVWTPTGEMTVNLGFRYSRTIPRLEVIREVPGTPWSATQGWAMHHLGYWSDDLGVDGEWLATSGFVLEAAGVRPDGVRYWSYHRHSGGLRIELVNRDLQSGLEAYFAGTTPDES